MYASLPRPLAVGLALVLAVGGLLGPTLPAPALAAGQAPDAAAWLTAQTPPPPPPPPAPPGGGSGQNPNPSQPATPPGPPSQPPPPSPPEASSSGSSAITLTLEEPAVNYVVTAKSLRVKGWAVDTSAPDGSGIAEVDVYIDGTRDTGSLLGAASYGQARRDVADGLGQGDRFLFSGFELDWTEVLRAAPGSHTITVAAYSPTNGWAERTVPVTIVGKLTLTAQAFIADPFPYGGVSPVYGSGAVPIYTRPITGTTGAIPPPPGSGYGVPYPNPGYLPAFIPVTFTAFVTRNGAPVPGAEVLIGAVTRMPPTDPNGYTQATVTLPLTGPQALVGSHLSVTFEGQTADADAYVRWYY